MSSGSEDGDENIFSIFERKLFPKTMVNVGLELMRECVLVRGMKHQKNREVQRAPNQVIYKKREFAPNEAAIEAVRAPAQKR